MSCLRIAVVYGSVRSARQGIHAARFIVAQCQERGHDTTLVDPDRDELPMLDRMYKEFEPGKAPQTMEDLATLFRSADAIIVVTGEYNHAPPPALLNVLDHFQKEFLYKPSAIVSYSAGSFGGVRAAVALRAPLAELGMSSIPSMLPVPQVQAAFDAADRPTDERMLKRTEKFLVELEWYARALRDARQQNDK